MSGLPPLPALRALEAAVRLRSYSRAADELGVTHSAVSQQIRKLEDSFGLRLFQREGNDMIATAAAERLARHATAAFRQLEEGVAEVMAEGSSHRLVISILEGFAGRWLAPRLPRFAAFAPDLQLEIRAEDRMADFVTDGVDVAIRYGEGPWPGLETAPLFPETVFPVCSPDFLARHPMATPQDLLGAPLLRLRFIPWRVWFRAVGLPEVEPEGAMTFDSSSLLLEAAAQGLGVALARSLFVEGDLRSGRLVRPFPGETSSAFGYHLVWRPDTPKRTAIERLKAWLLAEADQAAVGEA